MSANFMLTFLRLDWHNSSGGQARTDSQANGELTWGRRGGGSARRRRSSGWTWGLVVAGANRPAAAGNRNAAHATRGSDGDPIGRIAQSAHDTMGQFVLIDSSSRQRLILVHVQRFARIHDFW